MKNRTKDNKGITLIALIVTIIVMLILASVTTYTGIDAYKNSQVTKFVTQMQLLQAKVDDLVETKTTEELNNMGLLSVTTSQETNAIVNAFKQEEITTADTNKYKVFTSDKILEILDVEDVDSNIIVNFETREIVSATGVEYEGKTYYTQYKLPGGQTIINNSNENTSRTLQNFIIVPEKDDTKNNTIQLSIDGLNAKVIIGNIQITNATLKYIEVNNEEDNNQYTTIINRTEKQKEYTVNISKSGFYKLKLEDNLDSENYIETDKNLIILTNRPRTEEEIESYNYALGSGNWAYAEKNSVTYVWIPRFVYKTDEETEIKFVRGNSNTATDNTYIDNTWSIHEKFTTDNGEELTGIWISVGIEKIYSNELDYMIELLNSNAETLIEI